MKVLVDTSIWSIVLRSKRNERVLRYFSELIEEGRVEIIGSIRQEILSGIRSEKQFEQLKSYLDAFVDIPLSSDDYINAAQAFNRCSEQRDSGKSY